MLFLLLFASLVTAHVDVSQQSSKYWGERGLENPPRRLRELADWSLLYFNTTKGMRPILLFTIATPASTSGVLARVLDNLNKFKSTDQIDTNGNAASSLAEHTLVASTNGDAQKACDSLTNQFKHRCYELDHGFHEGLLDLFHLNKTKAHAYSVGLSRIKAVVDLISLGYDILYFDLHHFFFKNPLKYLYSATSAPVVVSATPATACKQLQARPDGTLPNDHHRLDIAFVRSAPSTFRCLYNWLYWSTHTVHEANDKPLDHATFRNVMQECVSSLTPAVISVEYLNPEHFPNACVSPCGCRDGTTVQQTGDMCDKDIMSNWVAMTFSCSGSAVNLEAQLDKYGSMVNQYGLQLGP